MEPISDKEGAFLLSIAKNVIKKYAQHQAIEEPEEILKHLPEGVSEEHMEENRGIFCTIHKIEGGKAKLRGCIGLPHPVMPLLEALIHSAKSACEDPRFQRLRESELRDITVEISVLTEPELIVVKKPEEYLSKIEPKKDGLIIESGRFSGLFLPQVWEQIPSKEDFLCHLCLKACLHPDAWKEEGTRIYRFYVQIFK